jgi:type IV pilus assembly protein PilC
MLMDFSEALREHALVIVLGGAAAAAAWWALRLFPATRELQDALLLKLPVAGRILRISGTAIFARSMEIMTSSGVTLLDGLESAAGILANRRMRSRAVEMRNSVLSGMSLADSVAPAKEFMPMLRHMAAVGEVSGSLPAAFAQTARFHELILALAIKRLGMLVEPVMIVVTGAIVGFVYIAFFMALFAIAGA